MKIITILCEFDSCLSRASTISCLQSGCGPMIQRYYHGPGEKKNETEGAILASNGEPFTCNQFILPVVRAKCLNNSLCCSKSSFSFLCALSLMLNLWLRESGNGPPNVRP